MNIKLNKTVGITSWQVVVLLSGYFDFTNLGLINSIHSGVNETAKMPLKIFASFSNINLL